LRGGDPTQNPRRLSVFATGWRGGLSGDLTLAWFMKQRGALPAECDLFGGPGNLRVFTGGAAGTGLGCAGWNGNAAPLLFTGDIQSRATNWLHIALVIDTVLGQARWYVDGVLRGTTPISQGVEIPYAPNDHLRLGVHQTVTNGNVYDLDEFRLCGKVASAATIGSWMGAALAASGRAASGRAGVACGANLYDELGPPTLGNHQYRLWAVGPPGSPLIVCLGVTNQLGAIELPFDLGAALPYLQGCGWFSDMAVLLPGVTQSNGSGLVPLAVPNVGALLGALLQNQAILLDLTRAYVSNAQIMSIER
jgi:hypothetical protein